MYKLLYKSVLPTLLFAVLTSCSNELLNDDSLTPGTTSVRLSGVLTRVAGNEQLIVTANALAEYQAKNVKFFLSARTDSPTEKTYFSNMPMSVGEKTPDGRNGLFSDVYYPLGKTSIKLCAHTGTAAADGEVPLVAGMNQWNNDILLGKGSDESGNEITGSSDYPLKYITFYHLMTKVDIKIEVDDSVKAKQPSIISIKLNNKAALNKGTYNMYKGTVTGTNASGDYMLSSTASNYLIPSGINLSKVANSVFSYIKIDDYVATTADLKDIIIPQAEKVNGMGETMKSDFILNPGLSYTLTFKINRLRLVSVKLTLNDWNTTSKSVEWGYDPYKIKLNIKGGYSDTNENLINKIALKHNDGANTYQYIGSSELSDSDHFMKFVTLPKNLNEESTLTADLYTKDGLLIKNVSVTYDPTTGFSTTIDKNGVVEKNGYHEIGTPLQFTLIMRNAEAKKYRLINDIDMNNTLIDFIPSSFPNGATLDGNKFSILHLRTTGDGLVSINKGTLRNLRIASGQITASTTTTYIGGICGINEGTIEGCINEADIVTEKSQTAGGICGMNEKIGRVLACLNTGNVSNALTAGGICGENKNDVAGAITACINTGLLNRAAAALGGICGKYEGAESKIIKSSYWLTGTARKDQAISNEVAIGNRTVAEVSKFTDQAADILTATIRSATIINKLSMAAGDLWDFEWDKQKSSWPTPVSKP